MASQPENPPKRATTVKFARKTSSGRYVSLSREDIDNMNYTVQLPPTPDNQPMDNEEASAVRHESLYGGIPRPRSNNKVVEPGTRASACAMPECNLFVMQDGHGYDIHPCECRYVFTCIGQLMWVTINVAPSEAEVPPVSLGRK